MSPFMFHSPWYQPWNSVNRDEKESIKIRSPPPGKPNKMFFQILAWCEFSLTSEIFINLNIYSLNLIHETYGPGRQRNSWFCWRWLPIKQSAPAIKGTLLACQLVPCQEGRSLPTLASGSPAPPPPEDGNGGEQNRSGSSGVMVAKRLWEWVDPKAAHRSCLPFLQPPCPFIPLDLPDCNYWPIFEWEA